MAQRRQPLSQVVSAGKLRWLWQLAMCLASVIKGRQSKPQASGSPISACPRKILRWL